MDMRLSVVIPCYNGADTIADQLCSLANQQWSEPWEILVANNRSTDESMDIVRHYMKKIPNLRIVDACGRQGQPFALNTGAEAARGESLAFCDADDVVGEGWVAAMGAALMQHDFVACKWEIEKLNPPWLTAGRRNPQETGLQNYTHPKFLCHAGGGSLGVKRQLHQAIGGFDETLPLLHDTDFCWRLQLAGTKLHFVPEAVMHIRYRDNLKSIYRQARGYAEYNVILYKKYRPLGMPALSRKKGLKSWLRRWRQLPNLNSKPSMVRWMWRAGWNVGRLEGSIKHGVWAL